MNAMELLTGPLAQAIGWALLHLLWQATIVAAILAAVLALMSKQSANARYVTACGALAILFAMFVATAIRAYDPAAAPIVLDAPQSKETIRLSLTHIPVLIAESAAKGLKERALSAVTSAREALPSIVAVWLAGVVLLSSRLLVSWIRARRLVRRGTEPATHEWQAVATRISAALGLHRTVQLLQSAAVEVPSVIGTLRPVILIPASALTGLTPEHIEMVLAHELAHIRRHDFFVNLLQAVAETLMFYHPAVWWMSQRVRVERENCCDDLAVAVCGNPIQYARALTRLEELRASSLPVVVAANGGSLLDRVRRIAAGRAERTASSSRWAAAIAMLALILTAVAVPSLPALAERQQKKAATEPVQPAPAAAEVDVIEEAVATEPGEPAPVAEAETIAAFEIDSEDDVDDSDYDYDYDYDYDGDLITPAPPAPPAWPVAPVPAPRVAVTPLPTIAVAPVPVTPRTPRTPPAPRVAVRAPVAFLEDRDADDERERPLGEGGKLTVDELVALRAHDVTPAYVNEMRTLFPELSLRDVTSMKAVGVTVAFVKEMRAAGFEVNSSREATSLAAVGVTPEFVRNMRAAGLEVTKARDASSLAAVGVTPEFISQMRDAGFAVKSAKEATGLAAVGVTPEWVREMRAAGFQITSAKDAQSMKAVGVTPEWVREMRAAGFQITSSKDAQSMKAVGVTPEWVREMRAAGVAITTARDAQSLRAHDVTPAFVKRLADAGYSNLSVRELSRLAAAGVDENFIREMEQYRKKN